MSNRCARDYRSRRLQLCSCYRTDRFNNMGDRRVFCRLDSTFGTVVCPFSVRRDNQYAIPWRLGERDWNRTRCLAVVDSGVVRAGSFRCDFVRRRRCTGSVAPWLCSLTEFNRHSTHRSRVQSLPPEIAQ